MSELAAIGFCAHTGWAASVVVCGPPAAPRILDRRRIRLSDSDDTVEAQVYHRAAGMGSTAAARLVRKAAASAEKQALASLRQLSRELDRSYSFVAAGIPSGGGRLPEELSAILRSHALIHAAEGELYRSALSAASRTCGLLVMKVPRKELLDRLGALLGTDAGGVGELLTRVGRIAGPPWAQDQREATMAALLAMASTGGRATSVETA